ncbi:MAG: hypothetical protein ACXABG_13920 [Promethearchaeota archaeon]|jgi:hypothetical protein
MTEITKKFKILLLINAIIGISFAFLYIVIPYYYLSLIEWPFFDPYYSWAFGGVFLILSSFLLRSIKKNLWEKCKSIVEIIIAWQILILILNIISLVFIPMSIVLILTTWILNIMFIILIGFNFSFLKSN